MPYYNGYIVVLGGNGAVGSSCVSMFKAHNWWVASIELVKNTHSQDSLIKHTASMPPANNEKQSNESMNKQADVNITVNPNKELTEIEAEILEEITKSLEGNKLDTVICMSNGFEAGNAKQHLSATVDFMWKQNVWPSILSVSIAVAHMREGGFLCLSGARAALQPTPSTIGYGLAKAAIHQLTKSLASEESALPANILCVALLPLTIDTIMHEQIKSSVDISGWTPTKYITDLLYKWSTGMERPANGSLVQFETRNFNTDISYVH